jgi:hypothetical protein
VLLILKFTFFDIVFWTGFLSLRVAPARGGGNKHRDFGYKIDHAVEMYVALKVIMLERSGTQLEEVCVNNDVQPFLMLINPLKPNCKYMYQPIVKSVTLHFVRFDSV